jgi:hypothetical protein
MPDNNPVRLAEDLARQLAEALCPWCGDDYDHERHPHAPPIDCAWCQKRQNLMRRVPYLSRQGGAPE